MMENWPDRANLYVDTLTGQYSRVEHVHKESRIVRGDSLWQRIKRLFKKEK